MDVFELFPMFGLAVAGIYGLLIGSFLNVVIHRVPARMQWQWRRDCREVLELPKVDEPEPSNILGRSRCPNCSHKIAWFENIPVFSWLALLGRCRGCASPISAQYPLVELLAGVLFLACAWRFGTTTQGVVAMAFSAFAVALAGIDLRTQFLPDQLTLPLLWLGLLASTAGIFIPADAAIIGAATGYLLPWAIGWVFHKLRGMEGFGHGDFKLLAAIGAFCGWQGVMATLFMASMLGAVIGGVWLAMRGRDRATPIPFGPYLAAAGWAILLWGRDISDTVPSLVFSR